MYVYLRIKKYHKIIKRECTRRIISYRIKSISSHQSNVRIAFSKMAPLSLKKFRAKDESEASLREADVQFSLFSLDEQIKFSKSKGSFSQSALRTADPSNRIAAMAKGTIRGHLPRSSRCLLVFYTFFSSQFQMRNVHDSAPSSSSASCAVAET